MWDGEGLEWRVGTCGGAAGRSGSGLKPNQGAASHVTDPRSSAGVADDGQIRDGRPGPTGRSRYLPVSEHGMIGDLHTVALVGTNGTIDWHCSPSFDSPSVFGSLLDADRGGGFELAAAVRSRTRQFYLPDTNVLMCVVIALAADRAGAAARSPGSVPGFRCDGA
jgi:hypothetical protein